MLAFSDLGKTLRYMSIKIAVLLLEAIFILLIDLNMLLISIAGAGNGLSAYFRVELPMRELTRSPGGIRERLGRDTKCGGAAM